MKERHKANAIRALSMDAVQKAASGHPGMPMGMADIAEVLFSRHMKHNPKNPAWHNRDRFVVSNGHGSMLLYALLHLTGYDVSIEDLKNFRQWHSKTPGHPEHQDTPGVETTTGPLGQGLANAVGMAIAESHLAARFNEKSFSLIDHYTYVFLGDGCLMEGISHEACSFAGTLKLGKLIAFYDDNGISIDGETKDWYTENVTQRFESYGWHVVSNVDGHDAEAVHQAILEAKKESSRPSMIRCKTTIGYGAPNKAGTSKVHGAPLGDDEIKAARKMLNWSDEPFVISDDLYQEWSAVEVGKANEASWNQLLNSYQKAFPEKAVEFLRVMDGRLTDGFSECVEQLFQTSSAISRIATRKASLKCLEEFSKILPELMGGSADLTESNLTRASIMSAYSAENRAGNYIYYGVREFGMSAIMNGLALYGGVIPFGGTFLVFADYARNAIRMAALMQQRSIFVLTHDSIGLGEDGPTHQPIEHLTMLRATPNLEVWRPANMRETVVAWAEGIRSMSNPTCLALSRQDIVDVSSFQISYQEIAKGAYCCDEIAVETPDIVLVATGSELPLAASVAKRLRDEHSLAVRVVSMPCQERFFLQDQVSQTALIPTSSFKVTIEAGCTMPWHRIIRGNGIAIGIDTFGASAPGDIALLNFGFEENSIVSKITKAWSNRDQ